MEQNIIIFLPISSSFPCQASCVDSKTIHAVYNLVLFMLGTVWPALCCPLKTFFSLFQNSTVDERHLAFHKQMLSLEFLKGLRVLIDHVSFGWGDTSNTRSLAASQFCDFFLDRWEVFILHPSTKNPDSCLALFAFYRLMTDHVLFERAFTGYNQVFSCKQFGDFFSTDERCSFFIPPQKIPTAVKHFWIDFVDWWLIMSHLNELLQVATESSAVSSVVTTFSTDERCLFLIPPQKTLTAVKHF